MLGYVEKKTLGQYFTVENPFKLDGFKRWWNGIKINKDDIILEPFAGSNNIVKLIKDIGIENQWRCFDIQIQENNCVKDYNVILNDSINNFPKGYKICITNPPYLGKSSASRMKLPYPDTHYEDLYMLCLEKMLDNCQYVAAIIPESFITSGLFLDRLHTVISLNTKMFDDTECPVCLALFSDNSDDVEIRVGDEFIGHINYLNRFKLDNFYSYYKNWKFNDPNGNIGIKCVDSQKEMDIHFHRGNFIQSDKIKISSRAFTRVSGLPEDIDLDLFINECNEILNDYRLDTRDIFLTSFKGLRKDGYYRRRIDFKTLRCIMNKALNIIKINYINKK